MDLSDFNIINEVFFAESISSDQLDMLLVEGWRHFGCQFFRYNVGVFKDELRYVLPLRVRVAEFSRSRSQRKLFRRNEELETRIQPVEIDAEKHKLFERHAERFTRGRPSSIHNFLDPQAATIPCETLEFAVYIEGELAAVSFLDVGNTSVSSIYAMFDPTFAKRSLGIYTMLLELEFARENGKEFYYQGYAYEGSSFYDYKKQFVATEVFDWVSAWQPLNEPGSK